VKAYSPENPKGLGFVGFDRFVDDLVQLYKESEDEEDEEEEDEDEGEGASRRRNRDDDDEDDEEGDEDLVEIDTVASFEKLSKGRSFITLQDVKGWEDIQDALTFAGFLDSDWKKVHICVCV
jgi:hypothetical protein